MMNFRKEERSCLTEPGWRLATVKEAQENRKEIERLPGEWEWDRARLLDGWIGGSAYGFQAKVGFRSCIGYMLLIETTTREIASSDDSREGLYDEMSIDEDGMNAALLLCCEDWNYEVVCWLLNRWSNGCILKINPQVISSDIPKASESVSAIARKLQSTVATKVKPGSQFWRTWMREMVSDIVNQVVGKIQVDTTVSRVELRDDIWNDMDCKEDSQWLKDFGFDTEASSTSTWEAVANSLGYVAADYATVAIVRNCVSVNSKSISESTSTGDRMEDMVLIYSIIAQINELCNDSLFRYGSIGSVLNKAAADAKGDIRLFEKKLRDQGCGTFSYSGNHFLNTILLQASKKGNVNLVRRLLDFGLRLLETDDKRTKTALHHAAKLDNEYNGMQIAKMLLDVDGKLANVCDYKQRTPLHRAAFCGQVEICKLLIANKSSVFSKDKNGQTPLHYALGSEQPNENVVRVLIEAKPKHDRSTPSTPAGPRNDASLVDLEDDLNKTPLEVAVDCQSHNVRMVTWLLSLSKEPERYFEKLERQLYLRESARSGYIGLVKKLLNAGANPLDGDKEGKTTLHYAAEGEDEEQAINIIKVLQNHRVAQFKSRDKYGRTVLHVAAFLGHKNLCSNLLRIGGMELGDSKDSDGQNALYYAVAGPHDNDEVLDVLIWGGFSGQGSNRVYVKDSSKTTPLHVAASRGNFRMVKKLFSNIKKEDRQKYVQEADRLGQTALHKAASGGHKKILRKLLENGAHPLEERDCDGKTALHYAAQADNDEDGKAMAEVLLKKCTKKEKSLLLFASAVGIGSAEESLRNENSSLRKYLCDLQVNVCNEQLNLLRDAATLGNIDMTRELLTRGGNISDIRDRNWITNLENNEKENVENVLKQIDHIVEQGTDKPALWDNLGRTAYANGLATLFLNPFVKSPITIGISGEWGMGKSSLMFQTESILLRAAAQLAFSNSLQKKKFPGAITAKLSKKGTAKREKIEQSIKRLSKVERRDVWECLYSKWNKFMKFARRLFSRRNDYVKNNTQEAKNQLNAFLGSYEPKYHEVFKSLAVMDRRDMFEDDKKEEESKSKHNSDMYKTQGICEGQIQGSIPSILTVRYNAWHYRSESEAWPGLAVEITKELEATMTVAQRLRTSWKYNWTKRKSSICIDVMIPCFLAVFIAIWCTIIVWLTLDRVKGEKAQSFKDLRYGSLPLTGFVMVWALVKSVMSVMKPISSQMVDYMFLPDHSAKLGYHQKVISDIKFLKGQLGYKPFWLWKVFAFIWCCITFCWDENYIPGTTIPKMANAPSDNLRMVVFVDDLDRCQENVILQILSAVNLVLAACEINVILGMDKRMIERAIIRMFGDKNKNPSKSSEELADKYLRKIIQLPLDLPDPSSSESKSFLEKQLGMVDTRKGATDLDAASETHTAHERKKMNPKFRIGSLNRRNPDPGAGDKTIASLDKISENGILGEKTTGEGTSRLFEKKQHTMESRESGTDVKIQIQIPRVDTAENKPSSTRGDPDAEEDEDYSVPRTVTGGEMNSTNSVCTLPENSQSDKQLVEISPITSEMLIPKYSEGEREAFLFLETKATGSRKLPREWKRLLNYHRLAWNILSKSREVKTLAGWQVQLIVWVFVCWQWRDPINTLIQNWGDLDVLKNWVTVNDDEQGKMSQNNSGPSLREIVESYIEERLGRKHNRHSLKRNVAKEEISVHKAALTVNKHESETKDSRNMSDEDEKNENYTRDDFPKENIRKIIREILEEEKQRDQGEQGQLQRRKSTQRTDVTKKEEEDSEEWRKLRETLTQFNVSMDGIQAFQKFRFHCVPGHLQWPLVN